jgi:hypothetical protein
MYRENNNKKQTPWPLVRERTIPTERPDPGVYSASNRNEYRKHKNNISGE